LHISITGTGIGSNALSSGPDARSRRELDRRRGHGLGPGCGSLRHSRAKEDQGVAELIVSPVRSFSSGQIESFLFISNDRIARSASSLKRAFEGGGGLKGGDRLNAGTTATSACLSRRHFLSRARVKSIRCPMAPPFDLQVDEKTKPSGGGQFLGDTKISKFSRIKDRALAESV
jgi:hypothetical protein